MLIEFDFGKRHRTLAQRGLDFERAAQVFDAPTVDVVDARFDYGEQRILTLGKLDGKHVVIVWTPRAAARRILSMRYANAREIRTFAARVG